MRIYLLLLQLVRLGWMRRVKEQGWGKMLLDIIRRWLSNINLNYNELLRAAYDPHLLFFFLFFCFILVVLVLFKVKESKREFGLWFLIFSSLSRKSLFHLLGSAMIHEELGFESSMYWLFAKTDGEKQREKVVEWNILPQFDNDQKKSQVCTCDLTI